MVAKYNVKTFLRNRDAFLDTFNVELSDTDRDSAAWLKAKWLTFTGSNSTVIFQTSEIGMIELTPVNPRSEPK